MKSWKYTPIALALIAAFPAAMAQSNADLLKELQNLQKRVTELEGKLKEAQTKPAGAAATGPQWGMTPEQTADFNRVQLKQDAIEEAIEAAGLKGLKITGYMDPAYIYNWRQDRAGFQFLNSQGDGYYYDTSFIGSAVIDFTKETESGTRWKLTLSPQRGVGEAIGAGIVQEASVSIPLTDLETRLIAGQIPDWSGYEYQSPVLNPFTTHNLLYDFTLPFAYTGVGLDLTRGDWWIRTMVANLNSTIQNAGDTSPVLAVRVDYSKSEFQGLGFAGVYGKVTNFAGAGNIDTDTFPTAVGANDDRTATALFEVDGYFTRGDWTYQGQVSYGQQKKASINSFLLGDNSTARWYGASGLVGFKIMPRLQLLARADYLYNKDNGGGFFQFSSPDGRNGIGPRASIDAAGDTVYGSNGANRYALSLGVNYAFNENTTFKAEYRFDGATQNVFEDVDSGNFKKYNQLLGTSVVVFF
jgi:hypothetical protein